MSLPHKKRGICGTFWRDMRDLRDIVGHVGQLRDMRDLWDCGIPECSYATRDGVHLLHWSDVLGACCKVE